MNREIHVRLCERLGAQFPGPTRRRASGPLPLPMPGWLSVFFGSVRLVSFRLFRSADYRSNTHGGITVDPPGLASLHSPEGVI
jgi:hypothetical protein